MVKIRKTDKIIVSLMLISIILFALNLTVLFIPKVTIVFESPKEEQLYQETINFDNFFYYCPGCYLTYEMDIYDNIIVEVDNLSIGVFALYYGIFKIFENKLGDSKSYHQIDVPLEGYFEILLIEFPQEDSNYILIKELRYLDNLTICMDDDGCRWS